MSQPLTLDAAICPQCPHRRYCSLAMLQPHRLQPPPNCPLHTYTAATPPVPYIPPEMPSHWRARLQLYVGISRN